MPGAPRSATMTFLWRFAISLVVTSVVMVGIVAGVNRGIDDRVAKIERIKLAVAPAPPQGANFLIIGSDTRSFVKGEQQQDEFGDPATESGQRSDTMMVAHVEPGSQQTVVVSFPRDLMVHVYGLAGENRINAAYATGGPQAVIETLKENFGIDINHYLEVDFKSFQAIVDAIGTVNIYVPGELRDPESGFTSIGAGCMPMNGGTALAYVRARTMQIADPSGDIEDENGKRWKLLDVRADLDRIQRQQTFVRQLAAVAINRSLSDPFTAVNVVDDVLGYLKADSGFGRDDANALIRAFRTVDVNNNNAVKFETIPTDPDPNNPNVTLVPAADADTVLDQLRTFGNDTPVSPTVPPSAVEVQVHDGSTTPQADAVARELAAQGFHSLGAGPVVKGDNPVTAIRYGANHADSAKTVLDYFPDAKLVLDRSLDGTGKVVVVLGHTFSAITVPSTTTTAPAVTAPGTPTTTTAPPTTTTTIPPTNVCSN